nr:uncharacterized protein LOC117991810 [Maniola hyperantus]
MELVSLVKELLQSVAERAASYRFGQSALRYMDRALWIVEKSARWAVPPPLDQDERPQPELIRPLPWVFFLALLIVLRVTRESVSLINLALGKPPLRPADVVTYLQGKRRYLRTLKYQGNRLMRARTEQVTRESWYSHLQSMFEFTMCFRRQHYGNNNTQLINGDEVLVVKRNKKIRPEASTVASTSETSMERLIEKMMVDVEVDSDESSSYTLTNITSGRSDRSDYNTDSEQETVSNTKSQVKHNQDSKTVKQTPDNTSLTASSTKTPVKQSLDNKTVKGTEDNNSLTVSNTKTSEKQSLDNKTQKETQDNTSLTVSNIKTPEKLDNKTERETQDNTILTASSTKTPEKESEDSEAVKEIQDNTSLAASSTKTPVKNSQDDKTVKQAQDISAKVKNIATSKSKKSNTGKSIVLDDSNDSMARLEGDSVINQERGSDTKEATMDFIQNEIGSHRSRDGYRQHKIANGQLMMDLTATER